MRGISELGMTPCASCDELFDVEYAVLLPEDVDPAGFDMFCSEDCRDNSWTW